MAPTAQAGTQTADQNFGAGWTPFLGSFLSCTTEAEEKQQTAPFVREGGSSSHRTNAESGCFRKALPHNQQMQISICVQIQLMGQ